MPQRQLPSRDRCTFHGTSLTALPRPCTPSAVHAKSEKPPFSIGPFERPESAADGEVVGTNFERKFIPEGREFRSMTLVKRS